MTNERQIRIPEEEAWRIYKLLEEMNDFLHQRANYKNVEDIHKWLMKGVNNDLRHVFYKIVGPWFPIDEETGYVIGPKGVLHKD